MTFSRKTLLTAVITLGALTVAQDVQAGCGRGGYRRGYSRGYSRSYSPAHSSGYGYFRSVPSVRTIQSQRIAPQQQFGQPQQQQQIGQQQFTQPQTAAPQQQFAPQQSIPTPAQTGNVQMTALQALGGFAPPQTGPTETAPVQEQTPGYIGNWTAILGNGANVQLALQSDGSFRWSATNKTGTASSFSGEFMVGNGSLALIRGNDNQRLEGNMTISGQNSFSFKVAGNNAAAISFSRN